MIRGGDLVWQVRLERASEKSDSRFGSAEPSGWSPIATVWAQRLPVSDGERIRAGQAGASLTDRWRLRWAPEIDPLTGALDAGDQLVDVETGKAFGILAVKVLGRREVIEITTQAQAG